MSKKNLGISLCRIVATMMIVICHFGTAYGYSSIGQFFQSGVQIFLLISGMLYGRKEILSYKEWLVNRWKRISVPCYIHLVAILLLCFLMNISISIVGVLEVVFNLEGYHHILTFLNNPWSIIGTSHLWFITAIFLCYLFVAIIKYNNYDEKISNHKSKLLISLFLISIVSGLIGIRIDYFVVFFAGYAFSQKKDESISKWELFAGAVAFVLAICLRLIGKKYCDVHGDNNIYLYIIIPYVYNVIAVSGFLFVKKIADTLSERKLLDSPLVRKYLSVFDGLSFYFFITHYMFLDGPISLVNTTSCDVFNIILILIGMTVSGVVLKRITEIVLSVFELDRR